MAIKIFDFDPAQHLPKSTIGVRKREGYQLSWPRPPTGSVVRPAHRARALGGSIASTRAARSCGRWHSREDDWSLSACEHLRRRDGGATPARSSTGPSSTSVLIPRALPRAENVSTALVARYRARVATECRGRLAPKLRGRNGRGADLRRRLRIHVTDTSGSLARFPIERIGRNEGL